MLNIQDSFGRNINYLRVSITDRCNLRCNYCMPSEGVNQIPHEEILSFDEIVKIVDFAVKQGINRIRITGGEPFVRKGFLSLLKEIKKIKGLQDLSITTNGILLSEYAEEIFDIGVRRINVSLDTLKEERFIKITRRKGLDNVLSGIKKIIALGFDPIKINTVIAKGVNDDEIEDFANLTLKFPLHVRFISLMPVGKQVGWDKDKYVSSKEIRDRLKNFHVSEKISGNGPANYGNISNSLGSIGFIDCLSEKFCDKCNRLRLTSDGKLRNCLFSDDEIDIKTMLRNNYSEENLMTAFSNAIKNKPCAYLLNKSERSMFKIGG